ncbi:Uncharacterized protein FKW44_021061, partial [Caligus rogercresseyi]
YGKFNGEHRISCLDHVYFAGLDCNVEVLKDTTTDHRPVLAKILVPSGKTGTRSIERRNFKAIQHQELEDALQKWPWTTIYSIEDVDTVHQFLIDGITEALNEVAPTKTIKVKTGRSLYLASDTLELMRKRDRASGSEYRRIRNQVSSLVKRDRICTNMGELRKSPNDPKVLWRLANEAIGKSSVNGISTMDNAETATAVNKFYIDKVIKLRHGLPSLKPPPSSWPKSSAPFSFSFASAGKIAKVVKAMRATEALGVDGIPVSVLKKGIEVLAGPISHLVNRSLASGTVPTALKLSNVLPIYKGKGKSAADPASYRPVCILPALSKILETVVKTDFEIHLAKTEALPNTQFGFRRGRSTTTALATAHAKG